MSPQGPTAAENAEASHCAGAETASARSTSARPLQPSPPTAARSTATRWFGACAMAGLVAILNLLVWQAFNPPLAAPDAPPRVAGLAYNAFQRWDSPLSQRFPKDTELADDLHALAGMTPRLRTYSASEFPGLPALAQQQGMKLALGVWLDRRPDANQRELRAAIEAARQHGNIERIIAGNETQLHRTLRPAELYAMLDGLRAAVSVPVSTAEPWHVWLSQPELARHVDFITVHLLPYWEGVPAEHAVDYALARYAELRERFPKKRIVIGEIGWPSRGDRVGGAIASPAAQAAFVREFLARTADAAARLLPDGGVRPAVEAGHRRPRRRLLGLMRRTRDRTPKFALRRAGARPTRAGARRRSLASLLGCAADRCWFAFAFRRLRLAGRIAFCGRSCRPWPPSLVLAGGDPARVLPPPGGLDRASRSCWSRRRRRCSPSCWPTASSSPRCLWRRAWRREFRAAPAAARRARAVRRRSICPLQRAAGDGDPHPRLAARLDYPNFEVLVVDNNTRRTRRLWQPVEAHCATARRPRFRFFHLPRGRGSRPGALELRARADRFRAPRVGVVDADYAVAPRLAARGSPAISATPGRASCRRRRRTATGDAARSGA